ncbi:porin family protein [Sphingobacterium paludis]|nr:porin family protein [Sphingobacterium paludis]
MYQIILCALLLYTGQLCAQHAFRIGDIQHRITVGYNLGASAPFSLPNTIREIKSYSPVFAPSIGYEATYDISEKWLVGAALRFDVKGMEVTDSVQYFHTIITVDNASGDQGTFEGDFSGTNATTVKNSYLTLPVYGGYRLGSWDFKIGLYVARLLNGRFEGSVSDGYIRKGDSLGEKVLIDRATFDFAEQIRKWDWGGHLAFARNFGVHWQATLTAQVGAQPIFPSSFKGVGYDLHNMYVTLGAAYRLW